MKNRCFMVMLLSIVMVFTLSSCNSDGKTESSSGSALTSESVSEDFVKMDLTYATFLLDNAPSAGIYERLQEKIDVRMDGMITITPYTNGSLLGQTEIFDGVIQGVADMGFVQASSLADRLKLTLLLEYPGIDYNCSTVACHVMNDYLTQLQPKELDDVVWMIPCNTAPNSIVSTKPIHAFGDLKGKQLRAVGVASKTVTELGATPVSMALPELYESLRNGLLDGAWIVPGAVGNSNLQEVAKYQIIVPIGGACQLVVMNKDKFNMMPPAQQELFMELANEVFQEYVSTYMEDFAPQEMSIKGFKELEELNYLEGEELQRWRDATNNLADEYAASLDAEGIDGTGALALARELAEKYNAVYPNSKDAYMMWRE